MALDPNIIPPLQKGLYSFIKLTRISRCFQTAKGLFLMVNKSNNLHKMNVYNIDRKSQHGWELAAWRRAAEGSDGGGLHCIRRTTTEVVLLFFVLLSSITLLSLVEDSF